MDLIKEFVKLIVERDIVRETSTETIVEIEPNSKRNLVKLFLTNFPEFDEWIVKCDSLKHDGSEGQQVAFIVTDIGASDDVVAVLANEVDQDGNPVSSKKVKIVLAKRNESVPESAVDSIMDWDDVEDVDLKVKGVVSSF